MNLPEIVQSRLSGEDVAARVSLGGEDQLLVTPTRTLIYRGEGLLSDESVEEYAHDAERIVISEGRRKAKVTLDYGLDGEQSFTLPVKHLDDALHPVMAGILNAAGITSPGETVKQTFRFSELTLVVTSDRLVKHIGNAVWDEDYEEFHYGDVTDLAFEEGTVATSVVLTLDGRQERFKAPNDQARAVRETLQSALLSFHGVDSIEELRERFQPEEGEGKRDQEDDVGFAGLDPLSTDPDDGTDAESAEAQERTADLVSGTDAGAERADDAGAGDGFGTSGFEPAQPSNEEAVVKRLDALTEVVEEQNEELKRQRELIEQLIDELKRGR